MKQGALAESLFSLVDVITNIDQTYLIGKKTVANRNAPTNNICQCLDPFCSGNDELHQIQKGASKKDDTSPPENISNLSRICEAANVTRIANTSAYDAVFPRNQR